MALAETAYLTMTRDEMLDVRWKTNSREQPNEFFEGQRIKGEHRIRPHVAANGASAPA